MLRATPSRILDWLDHRIGVRSMIVPIFTHPIPKGLNWSYVLGSATLVAFIIQVVTGVALGMTYVPSTDAAYESIRFISDEAPLGRFVRGAHYFGATAMVILVFAHMVQVFLIASYKYPRELNWLSGSVLLLLTLALAFTGQLLRWEQNAYWSIVVAVEQIGKTPFIGGALMQLLLAGWTVGPATLTRFYATHVFLLPGLVFLFLGLHLYLVIRLGISETPRAGHPVDPRTYPRYYQNLLRQGEPFFPNSFVRDAVAALIVTIAVVVLAMVIGPPELGEPADPTVVVAYPRPDWYFLWYFALLALIPRATEVVVILGFPLVVAAFLLILPFVSNQGERSPRRRPWAVGSVLLFFIAFLALTYQGLRSPWSPVIVAEDPAEPVPSAVVAGLSGDAREGADVYVAQACWRCHAIQGQGGIVGPSLTNVGLRLKPDDLVVTILAGRGNMPGYGRTIAPEQLEDLVAFLTTLQGAPPPVLASE